MRQTCDECGKDFDDVYQLTYCPHVRFEMRTLVVRDDLQERICTTEQEVDAFLQGEISNGVVN